MVVGDDDQSIYKFRGATIENILNFDRNFEDATVIKLEQNYRSTQTILDAANAVIANNLGRRGKNLWTASGAGDKILVRKVEDQNEESRFIVDKIQSLVSREEANYRDFAVLYRNNAQSSSIERAFAKSGVPYRMLGGTRFNDRKEIRDIVAYLHLIENHNDRERLLRIINEPKRKIGDKTIEAVEIIAMQEGLTMFQVLEQADQYVALGKSAPRLMEFAALINSLTSLAADSSLEVLVKETIDRSGYRQMLIDGGEPEKDRLDNLEEFLSGVIEYERSVTDEDPDAVPTLMGFLEENALVADVDKYDESADAVIMMTIHSAKGLEFPMVFLPGMEDGIFPGMQSVMGGESEIEEERRLAYVAITRAKKALYISHANNRLLYGRTQFNPPSRFLAEIPEELVSRPEKEMRERIMEDSFLRYGGNFAPQYDKVTITHTAPKRPATTKREVFCEGDRVMHPTFGEGEILSVKPLGADTLYEITFERAGTKKLMATFAKLKKID
jgi:DNA helicase-2/ATP-dependent DNA helicase PcrA